MQLDSSFPKDQHLKNSKEIRGVFEKGEKQVGTWMILYAQRLEDPLLKAGFIVSKKVGNAVVRNRVKRLMREAFRRQKHLFGNGLLLVFVARSGIKVWSFISVFEEVAQLARRLK